ncbi:MAG: DUF3277 family protein [Candidatus Diapherotrites archaeon]|nr:DUF3277 family protein [Candidatus Diapherotrites archaeon]
MSAYSFKDVVAALKGASGSVNIGSGAGVSSEGIVIVPTADKNVMTIGADGQGMHALSADTSCSITVNLLKTSPVNALLQQMYNSQTSSASLHGQNTMTIRDSARGDSVVMGQVAFKKQPDLKWTKDGDIMIWMFDAISMAPILGSGTPSR